MQTAFTPPPFNSELFTRERRRTRLRRFLESFERTEFTALPEAAGPFPLKAAEAQEKVGGSVVPRSR